MKSYVYVDTGPFFPIGEVPWRNDLTTGATGAAIGRTLYLFGILTGREGTLLANAEILIWQADANGLYRHPRAAKPDELDPNFGYFGRTRTNADGRYLFRTILPKWYRVAAIERAAHIHFAFRHPDEGFLLAETYFDDPDSIARLKNDAVFHTRQDGARDQLITPLLPASSVPDLSEIKDESAKACRFDLTFQGS
jgi:protocatechuate 3,4-dioxygenase beta subunit